MGLQVNPTWIKKIESLLAENQFIDETISFSKAAKWLIYILSSRNISFKSYSLGSGVVRITTNVNICPCCKKPLS